MPSLSRCVAPCAFFLASAAGARVARKRVGAAASQFIAGVPVLNYQTAYGGKASLQQGSEQEQEWVIIVEPGTTDAQVKSMCKANRDGCNLVGHMNGGVPFVELRGTERDLEAVLIAADGAAKFVEPDQEVHLIPELDVHDAETNSWGLNRVGADQRSGASGTGATVFVLDTGVRVSHQDFGGRAGTALDMTSGRPVECNGDQSCANDGQGHGTHCAGTAAGLTYGVAPGAAVKAVKVLSDSGSGSFSWSYSALDWMATSSIRPAVASMSLGGPCPFGFCGLMGAMKTAVDSAVAAGVTVVVAGGNSNSDACGFSPAFVPSAITVGSTDSEDARSYFSNYGRCTDIWAPGSAITSASHEDDSGAKTFSGTSMACPHVSGGAALVLEQNPDFLSEQVLDQLLSDAATNYITDLKAGDTNKMLYVGSDAPPPKGNVPAL